MPAIREKLRQGKSQLAKARLMRMRQAATNIGLIRSHIREAAEEAGETKVLNALQHTGRPVKHERCLELLKEEILAKKGREGKAIIWSYYIRNINQLSKFLADNGIENEKLYGATPMDNDDDYSDVKSRSKIIDDFHNDRCPYKVIVANPQAVGESISLHKACHNAIYMDRDFSAAIFIQSKDRIHRYGLKKRVNYYFLMSEDTVDKTIHDRLEAKEKRMLELIDKEEIPLLNLDELEETDFAEDAKATLRDYDKKQTKRK